MKKEKKKRLRRLHARSEQRREEKLQRFTRYTGKISIAHGGFGFITPDVIVEPEKSGAKADVFVPPHFVNGALNGDSVEYILLEDDPQKRPPRPGVPNGPIGRVIGIHKRAKEYMTGILSSGHHVTTLDKSMADEVYLKGDTNGAKRGDWVQIKLLDDPHGKAGRLAGVVEKNFGQSDVIKNDLDAICSEYNLEEPYTEEENAAASALQAREIIREDWTKRHTLTIDPFDAKDFDDAISIERTANPDQLEIGIHISDVASWIAPGEEFDIKAQQRAFTSYLPGRTLPMLPKTLTANISLQAGVPSRAHTVAIVVDLKSGEILKSRRIHTLIHVDQRLNYDEVQNCLDGGKMEAPETTIESIRLLAQAVRAMRKRRKKVEIFLNLDIDEIRVLCDENANKIIGLESHRQRESEELVEECMLAANSVVAEELLARKVPGLFRVHDEPSPDKLDDFALFAKTTFGVNCGDLSDRGNCARFLENLPDGPMKPVLLGAFLRSMPRAAYSESCTGHYGLGKAKYSHFTSPIRRYTDLAIHQQLWHLDKGEELKSQLEMKNLAEYCSASEENKDNAYYAANDRLKLRYLQETLGAGGENMYKAIVTRVMSNGFSAEICDLGIYGFVSIDDLPGRFRRAGDALVSISGRQQYKMGDYVLLRLSDIDTVKSVAQFKTVKIKH